MRIAAIVVGVAIVAAAALNWSSIASFVTDNASTSGAKTAIGFYLVIAGGIVHGDPCALLPAKSS
ncbi:MAG: hypothetical protein R2711_15020 [Acidimicrobiales bacterium]